MFIETSAKTGYNVKRMFMRLASALPPSGYFYSENHQNRNTITDTSHMTSVVLKSTTGESDLNVGSAQKKNLCSC